MTRGGVLVSLRHILLLLSLRRDVAETVRAVRQQLRELGAHGLADQLTDPLRKLGQMNDLGRAMEGAARDGRTVDEELRRIALERQQRRGREVA